MQFALTTRLEFSAHHHEYKVFGYFLFNLYCKLPYQYEENSACLSLQQQAKILLNVAPLQQPHTHHEVKKKKIELQQLATNMCDTIRDTRFDSAYLFWREVLFIMNSVKGFVKNY